MSRPSLLLAAALLSLPFAAQAIHRVELDPAFTSDGVALYPSVTADVRGVAHLPFRAGGSVAVLAVDGAPCVADFECVVLAFYDERGNALGGGGPPSNLGLFTTIAAAAIDSRDRIVVVGSVHASGGDYDLRIMRLLPDGHLDTAFSGDGHHVVALDRGGENGDFAHAVAIDAQDRIVVVGQAERGAELDTDFAVVRLRSDGAVDATFGPNTGAEAGSVIVPFDLQPAGRADIARAVAIGANGDIVVAGTVRDHDIGLLRLGIARLRDDGSYDTDWCNPDCLYNDYPIGSGRRTTYLGDASDPRTHQLYDVAVGDGGEVVIVGGSRSAGVFAGYVQRFAYDGEWQYEAQLDAGDPDPGSATAVGAINLVRPGSPASDIIVTGTTGPVGARTFFAQRLSYDLFPVTDWGGSAPDGSIIHFIASDSLFDPGGNLPGMSRLDRRGRLLVSGSIDTTAAAGSPVAGVVARITSSDLVFYDGFQD